MDKDMHKNNSFIFSSKKNLLFFFKLLLLFIIVIAFLLHVMPQYSKSYTASLIDKVERLESIDEPKIVLIGNSNLAFGIKSEMIEEAFDMPVVNMGLHGAIGNAFHEQMAKLNVHEGDIYIIAHTSYADDDSIPDPTIAWLAVEDHMELWKLLRSNDIWKMIKSYPIYLSKALVLYANGNGNSLDDGTSREAFNKYGDVISPRPQSEYTFVSKVRPPSINDITINRINELNEYLQKRGATLLVAGYPIGKGELTAPEEEFVAFQEELASKLTCTVISDFRDYMFDYKYFYNTQFHLTDEGTILRTKQLILDLQNYLDKN
jgi:hypothetical protein